MAIAPPNAPPAGSRRELFSSVRDEEENTSRAGNMLCSTISGGAWSGSAGAHRNRLCRVKGQSFLCRMCLLFEPIKVRQLDL